MDPPPHETARVVLISPGDTCSKKDAPIFEASGPGSIIDLDE